MSSPSLMLETIPEFFSGKTVFITGATGFMGKILIEKLLRSCPGVAKIYVLMRCKGGVSYDKRLQDMTRVALFDILRKEQPSATEEKLVALEGDVTMLGLGLSPKDRQLLLNNVNVIFHVAASITFNDPLKDAIIINTRGTREVINLALQMTKISVFLHVSTTYCNVDRLVIKEQLYPPHADWRTLIEIAENVDQHTLQTLLHKYLGKMPNTYTFTKSMAEHVVRDLCENKIPAVIYRPSIVVPTFKEPFPGWLDTLNGPLGMLTASGKGILRSCYSDPDIISDYVPADIVTKGLIIAAWSKGTRRDPANKLDVDVYNASSYKVVSVSQGEIIEIGKRLAWEVPIDPLWFPDGQITRCKYWHYINVFFLHFIPAVIVDLFLKVTYRKPVLLKLQRKIFSANNTLHYFLSRQWSFLNDRFLGLEKKILPEDREAFAYCFEELDVWDFYRNAILGTRQFMFHKDNSKLDKARITIYRLYVLHVFVKTAFYLLVFWWSVKLLLKIDCFSYCMNGFEKLIETNYRGKTL